MFQRLINQSHYQEIILLQKFNDIGGKVLKPKEKTISHQLKQKNNEAVYQFNFFLKLGFRPRNEMSGDGYHVSKGCILSLGAWCHFEMPTKYLFLFGNY